MYSFQYLAPIPSFRFLAPSGTEELLEELAKYGQDAKLIAGGTDLMIALKQRLINTKVVIDLSRLRSELSGVSLKDGRLRIGSMTTYTDIERNPLVQKYATALSVAASQVGTYQIRNLGTIGGNLANASPAADTAPALIVMDASVYAQSSRGERVIAVQDLFAGVKKTILDPDELITSVDIPIRETISSYWMRLAKRNENVISIVSVAVSSEIRENEFAESRISLGAVATTPILAKASSRIMTGAGVSDDTIEKIAVSARAESSPISDVRASAEYRRHLVYILTKRTISRIIDSARHREE